MPWVDLGIDWVGLVQNFVHNRHDLDSSYWTSEFLKSTPYYRSAYRCPICDDDRAALMKIKLKEHTVTSAPKVFGSKEVGLWNLFTCPNCGAWFASLNYVEGEFDISDLPPYVPAVESFTLDKLCLCGTNGGSYSDWQSSVRKSLTVAKDKQFNI